MSERSQLTYLFRRGRPTIANHQTEEYSHPLCALCLHPIKRVHFLGSKRQDPPG
jgi:hypothetical protein